MYFQEMRFVDERRKKLQLFLRKTIQHIVSKDENLASDLCKAKLVSCFSMLGLVN